MARQRQIESFIPFKRDKHKDGGTRKYLKKVEELKIKKSIEDGKTREYLKKVEELKAKKSIRERFTIQEKEAEIINLIKNEDVVIIQASTSAGKSLSIGKMTMQALGEEAKIAMTQPRRNASEGVATAVAARYNMKFGRDVSFSTSEYKGNKKNMPLQIQTTGILLNQFKSDEMLQNYDAIIVDEAHERDLNIDLCLGLSKRANQLRSEKGLNPLKIIICSADLPEDKFKNFFQVKDKASLKIEGRQFPIKKNFLNKEDKFIDDGGEDREIPYTDLAVNKAKEILNTTSDGDILIFMPGINKIRSVMDGLNETDAEILSLHGDDSMEDRDYVLSKMDSKKRRVIVSTNIAETSITVPGIKYVIDSCRKKENRYDTETRSEDLPDVPATQAECEQRAGRAGRIENGEVYYLLTEEEFQSLEKYPQPEILRANLSGTILKMISLGIKDIENFDFVDTPSKKQIDAAIDELTILNLIDNNRNLTSLGKKAENIPMDPRLATVVASAIDKNCLRSTLVITSLVNRPIFKKAKRKKKEAEEKFKKRQQDLKDKQEKLREGINSEWLYYLKIFKEFQAAKKARKEEIFCQEHGLQLKSLERAIENYYKIIRNLKKANVNTNKKDNDDNLKAITQAILAGFAPDHLLRKKFGEGKDYIKIYDDYEKVRLSSACTLDNVPLSVALKFNKGRGREKSPKGKLIRINTFQYAHCLHPLSSSELMEAVPHLVKKKEASGFKMDEKTGKVLSTHRFFFKNKKGSYMEIPSEDFFEKTPETGYFLAKYMLDLNPTIGDEDEQTSKNYFIKLLKIQENRNTAEKIKKVNIRSMGETKDIDLKDFYAKKFGTAATKKEVEGLANSGVDFELKTEDYYTDDDLRRIEKNYPEEIEINGFKFKIEYSDKHYSTHNTSYEDSHTAYLSTDNPENFIYLDDKDLEKLEYGFKKNLLITYDNGDYYKSIDEMKTKKNEDFKQKKIDKEHETQFFTPEEAIEFDKKNTMTPKKFEKDLFGNDFLAYPVLEKCENIFHNKNFYDILYGFRYVTSKKKADSLNWDIERMKKDLENEERREEAFDKFLKIEQKLKETTDLIQGDYPPTIKEAQNFILDARFILFGYGNEKKENPDSVKAIKNIETAKGKINEFLKDSSSHTIITEKNRLDDAPKKVPDKPDTTDNPSLEEREPHEQNDEGKGEHDESDNGSGHDESGDGDDYEGEYDESNPFVAFFKDEKNNGIQQPETQNEEPKPADIPKLKKEVREEEKQYPPIAEMTEDKAFDELGQLDDNLALILKENPDLKNIEALEKAKNELENLNTNYEELKTKIGENKKNLGRAKKKNIKKSIKNEIDKFEGQKKDIDIRRTALRKKINILKSNINNIDKALKRKYQAMKTRHKTLSDYLEM